MGYNDEPSGPDAGKALPGMTVGDVLAFKERKPKVRPKKLYLRDLEKHDREHDDSSVRLLEMVVDSLLPVQSYALQFWSDVRLYGVDEAASYLRNAYPDAKYEEFNKTVAQIRKAVESGESMNEE